MAVIACIYGTAMEFIQKYFIPNRDFDVLDIAADVVGALGGYFVSRLIIKSTLFKEIKSKTP